MERRAECRASISMPDRYTASVTAALRLRNDYVNSWPAESPTAPHGHGLSNDRNKDGCQDEQKDHSINDGPRHRRMKKLGTLAAAKTFCFAGGEENRDDKSAEVHPERIHPVLALNRLRRVPAQGQAARAMN